MATIATEWVLNLGGNIQETIKKMVSGVKDSIDSVKDLGDNWGYTEKKTIRALASEEAVLKETRKELALKGKELADLEKAWKKAVPGKQSAKAKYAVEKLREEVNKLKEKLFTAGENARTLKEDLEQFSKIKVDWGNMAFQANQFVELAQKITSSLNFAVDVKNMRRHFELLTDLSGTALDKFLSKSRELADVYSQDAKTVGEAANALTKQMGGSYESNLAIIEEGLKRGADLNGDYLGTLKRYAPALQEMGIAADEVTSLIATAAKKGIDPGNFIEGLQKAGVELRKMTSKTEAALADIGVKRADLEGKSAMEAVQHITEAMDGMTDQAKQMTISRIFKMQGERSGAEFIMGLSEGIPPLDEIPAVAETATGFKTFFSNIKTWAGDAFGTVAKYSQAFAPTIQMIAGAIPILTALKKVTWLNTYVTGAWTVATKILGKTILGIPIIGWIAAIITAIIAVVKYTEGWGKAWDHTFNGMKLLVKAFVEGVKANFMSMVNSIMIAIDMIKIGWYKFQNAIGRGNRDENNAMIKQLNDDVENRKKSIVDARKETEKLFLAATGEFIKAGKSIKLKKDDEDSDFSVNNLLKDCDGLSFLDDDDDDPDGKKGKKDRDGLNVGSGAGGVKNITMTLNMTQYFSVSKDTNIRNIADQIVGMVNDRLKDSLATVG